ncbi:MAG TPA: SigB/SigF/SigG family RNA polymerase sigma factor [Thermoleophilaceae bacterium]|nr:SigB/SigF/SigG family RNA polymerase sigma factor [Thermoleophilaceae bacterium]
MLSERAGWEPDHYAPYPRGGRASDSELAVGWRERGDRAARDELVARYLPLARRLARRWRRPNEAPDDLEQVAALALVKALDRLDPSRDGAIASFLVPTILGELKRWFRDKGWAVRVPRDLQEQALRVDKAATALSKRTGVSPTVAELAQELGIAIEDVIEAQEAASAYRAVPLTQPAADADGEYERPDASLAREDPGYGRAEDRAVLDGLVRVLSARERQVLHLRFVEDLTQSEIGERIGVSQMQVSRLIRAALAKLQEAAHRNAGSA